MYFFFFTDFPSLFISIIFFLNKNDFKKIPVIKINLNFFILQISPHFFFSINIFNKNDFLNLKKKKFPTVIK